MVYIIQANDRFKIGKAKRPQERISNAQSFCPYKIRLILIIDTNADYEVEKYLHEYFSHKKAKGEWFFLQRSDIDWIAEKYREKVLLIDEAVFESMVSVPVTVFDKLKSLEESLKIQKHNNSLSARAISFIHGNELHSIIEPMINYLNEVSERDNAGIFFSKIDG